MADSKVSSLSTIPAVDRAADYLYIVDTSAGTSNKTTTNQVLGITGAPVGTTDVQTLTNKTITAPTISSPVLSGTITGTYTIGGTPTFPSSVVTLTGSQTLTNKTLTSPTINTATISNPTLTVDAISEFTSANGVTIDGLNIKDNKLNTTNSVVTSNITDAAVTPAKLVAGTGSSWGWQSWTPTWTNLSVGNGTLNYAKYGQTGKTVTLRLKLTLGSTSSVSGIPRFSVPVTANADFATDEAFGSVQFGDATGFRWRGWPMFSTTTTVELYYINTSANQANTSSTAPFTWAVNDTIFVWLTYEAA